MDSKERRAVCNPSINCQLPNYVPPIHSFPLLLHPLTPSFLFVFVIRLSKRSHWHSMGKKYIYYSSLNTKLCLTLQRWYWPGDERDGLFQTWFWEFSHKVQSWFHQTPFRYFWVFVFSHSKWTLMSLWLWRHLGLETHSCVSSAVDERILGFFLLIVETKSHKVSNYIIYLFLVYLQCCRCKTNFLVITLVKRSYIIALPEFQCN